MPARSPRLLIALLTGAMIVEFAHRMVFAMLLEPIRIELRLSDSQMGSLLTVFALAYAPLAIGLGALADRGSRRLILAGCVALWSTAGGACAAAGGFASLCGLRALVGAAQAGNAPIGQALIADALPAERRAGAIGIVTMGGMLGGLVGLLLGGVANDIWGWRATLAGFGVGGAAFALLLAALLPEPARVQDTDERSRRLRPMLHSLLANPTYRHLSLGGILASTGVMSIAQWTPAFFQRVHGLDSTAAGAALAAISVVGALGTLAAGIAANLLWKRDVRFTPWIAAAGCALATPLYALALGWPDTRTALILLAVPSAASMAFAPTMAAATQAVVPARMRAGAAGTQAALLTLVGMGLGPILTGALSDALVDRYGDGALGAALTAVAGVFLWSACHFLVAARSLRSDLAEVDRREVESLAVTG